MRILLFFSLLFLALITASLSQSQAQFSSGVGFASSADKVSVELKPGQDKAHPGTTVRGAVQLTLAETWHINAHFPTEDYLIGTTLDLKPVEGIIVADISYPEGEDLTFAFSEKPLSVYEETVTIFYTLRISDKLAPGNYTLSGELLVQACDDQVCLAPSTIPVEVPLLVVDAGEPITLLNEALFAKYDTRATASASSSPNELLALFESEGSLAAFFAIFLIGLALNLTPCVYPMMSVTVSIFGAQTETKTIKVFFKALVYVFGIASMYSVLGVTAALSGGLFGSWLQSPWVLGGIAALLFALALSMFGLYQLQAPYWLTSKLGGTTGTSLVSTYVSGLVVGVFAAPCIGPPVIALLALVGAKGDPVFGFWVFFVLSSGLGLPYLILGTFSGLLKKIPRSGDWMIWVERIFGVVLVAAALFYLSLAVAPKLAAYVPAFALIAGGLYLGFFEQSGKEKKLLTRIKRVFGVATIALGLVFANALREPGLSWSPYSDELLAQAKNSGTPVMIDFYADWCIPCLELDRKTFTDAGVIDAGASFVRLKVDLTHFDSPEAEALRKQFNIAGVPTILFLDRDGIENESARVIGYLSPEQFLQRMKSVTGE